MLKHVKNSFRNASMHLVISRTITLNFQNYHIKSVGTLKVVIGRQIHVTHSMTWTQKFFIWGNRNLGNTKFQMAPVSTFVTLCPIQETGISSLPHLLGREQFANTTHFIILNWGRPIIFLHLLIWKQINVRWPRLVKVSQQWLSGKLRQFRSESHGWGKYDGKVHRRGLLFRLANEEINGWWRWGWSGWYRHVWATRPICKGCAPYRHIYLFAPRIHVSAWRSCYLSI